jgi:hypothetical protein
MQVRTGGRNLGFAGAKQKNRIGQGDVHGDVWLWIATDADSKLMPSWLVGGRDSDYARAFIADLADRQNNACNSPAMVAAGVW